MVKSLQWPYGDAPTIGRPLSVWPDLRSVPVEEMVSLAESLPGRRSLKAHLPATALPWSDDVSYVAVFRNPADTVVSWANHRAAMFPDRVAALNEVGAQDGLTPLREDFDGHDYHYLLAEWSLYWNSFDFLATWWPRRHADNVLLLHYADLYADLEAGMRRLAEFLHLDVPDECWPQVVDRCGLDEMRETARIEAPGLNVSFQKGADSFFYKGGNGRGAALLPVEILHQLDDYGREMVSSGDLSGDALVWLNDGAGSGVMV